MMFTCPLRIRPLTLLVPLSLLWACSGEEGKANAPSSAGGSTGADTSEEASLGGSGSPEGLPSGGAATGGGLASGGATDGVVPDGTMRGEQAMAGASTGSEATGGASAEGEPTAEPEPGGAAGSSALADQYPCDGDASGYDAVVTGSGSNWSMNGAAHGSLLDALVAALGSGGSSEADKRTVLLRDSGDVPANVQLRIPSNTVLNACGTIHVVAPTGGSDRSPCYARNASNIDIPHITITGVAQYGCFFREVDNVHIGVADLRIGGGLGMRFDNNPAANDFANSRSNATRRSGYQLDDVYVEGASHGVEFYGVEDIAIGRVVARNLSQAGLMLNNSRNIEVGLVDGQGVSPNAGYAVFRMANDNGKDWDSNTHPMSIHVGKVIARESGGANGQGIFCLTDSGGVTIDEVDLENTASNSIWLEWCSNVVIGNPDTPSRIHDSGNFMISYGTDTRMSNDLVFENIAITETNIDFNQDCPPNVDWVGVTRNGAAVSTCE